MTTTSIIVPIKTNNERLPGKNTRLLNGKPLYAHLFATLRSMNPEFRAVYIDSSDEEILDAAIQYGFTPSLRPVEYNQNHITGDELIARIINNIESDLVGLLHVTTPFLTAVTIRTCIKTFASQPDTDSVIGIIPRHNRFWFEGRPVNHDPKKLMRTQDLIPVHEETDIYFFRKSSFLKHGKRVCGNVGMVPVLQVESLDIDTLADFVHAEAIISAGLEPLVKEPIKDARETNQ